MNIAIAQSGGPTAAINASLLGVFRAARKSCDVERIFGSRNGIEGIINENLVDLQQIIATEEDEELLKQTPAAFLGSCRYKLADVDKDTSAYEKIIACFEKHGIGAFFYIGGNDSMDTVAKLSEYMKKENKSIKVIGVPKTIDNDLVHTDHTPGFGSAAKYLAVTLSEIARDISVYDTDAVTVVEIMGRHAGWLAASSVVLRENGDTMPHLIYLPECSFSLQKFLSDVREKLKTNRSVLAVVAEGVGEKKRANTASDGFGHGQIAGIGKYLEEAIKSEIGCKVRSIELNIMQRCSAHLTSVCDIEEAEMIGASGFAAAMMGETGKMMTFVRTSDEPYQITVGTVDAKDVANKEKTFPEKWIAESGNDVLPDAIPYFLPLIKGERPMIVKNGIPLHFILK
ncbi:MAG: 6-phosphofructokinase [Clostridia bacterium]|nr:6-phosphofructokinase [Clostridia bacterium]